MRKTELDLLPYSTAVSLFLFNPSSQTTQPSYKDHDQTPSETAKLHQENGHQYSYRHKHRNILRSRVTVC